MGGRGGQHGQWTVSGEPVCLPCSVSIPVCVLIGHFSLIYSSPSDYWSACDRQQTECNDKYLHDPSNQKELEGSEVDNHDIYDGVTSIAL